MGFEQTRLDHSHSSYSAYIVKNSWFVVIIILWIVSLLKRINLCPRRIHIGSAYGRSPRNRTIKMLAIHIQIHNFRINPTLWIITIERGIQSNNEPHLDGSNEPMKWSRSESFDYISYWLQFWFFWSIDLHFNRWSSIQHMYSDQVC